MESNLHVWSDAGVHSASKLFEFLVDDESTPRICQGGQRHGQRYVQRDVGRCGALGVVADLTGGSGGSSFDAPDVGSRALWHLFVCRW